MDDISPGADPITRAYHARPNAAEVADVLGQRVFATVGTLNEDGSIHLAYVAFLHEAGRCYFDTASVTRKARNAETRGWASILVQGRAASGRHLMVSGEGQARIVRADEGRLIHRRVRAKYARPEALDALNQAWDRLDDIAVEITPQRWRSWTSAPLREITSGAVGTPYRDIWMPESD